MRFTKHFSRYLGLPRSIYTLFFAIIVNRLGQFVIPFLALYLTEKLNYSPEKTGLFMMLASFAGIPGIFLSGILVDRIGRKRILVLFQFLSACCFLPCAVDPSSPVVPWMMILSVFFAETAQVAHIAMATDLSNNENRKEAFSLIYLGINIGCAIGPAMAGLLFNSNIRIFFLADTLTTLASVLLILLFTHETLPDRKTMDTVNLSEAHDEKEEKGSIFVILLKRPFFLCFLVLNLLYIFVYVQHAFSLPLCLNQLFGEDGPRLYGLIMTVNAVFVVLTSTLITMLTRKLSSVVNIAIAGVLYAVGFGMIFFIKSPVMFVLSTVVWTTGEILSMVNMNVYMAQHSPVSHRGRFNSVRLLFGRAGMALGPLVMGFVITSSGLRSVWPLVFLIAIVAAAGMFGLNLLERNRANGSTAALQSGEEVECG